MVISSSYSFEIPKTRKTSNLKFQMGITGVPFGRTEVLVPPLEPQEHDLARGKVPRGPGGSVGEAYFVLRRGPGQQLATVSNN